MSETAMTFEGRYFVKMDQIRLFEYIPDSSEPKK